MDHMPAQGPRTDPPQHSTFRGFRLLALACCIVVGLLAGGFAVFAHHVSKLETPQDVASADAIIVLTGGQSRLEAALGLLERGKAKRLLISGVNPVTGRKALRAATGSEVALFDCCVDIDRAALDTIGNAQESAKWLTRHGFSSVILVTNNYHMPRSLLELNRVAGDVSVTPYAVVNTRLDGWRWIREPAAIRVLVTEYMKFLAAMVRRP